MVELGDVLKAIGPNASIVFAAWIFMTFLQQRYDSAIDRYRETVGDYRSNDHDHERAGNLKGQILVYRHRCKLMGWATLIGLVAAILLISALIFGAIDVIVPKVSLVAAAGTATAIMGFLLVILAAIVVIIEGQVVHRQLDDELRDIPDLVEATKHGGSTPVRQGVDFR
jgi:amino acid transporter